MSTGGIGVAPLAVVGAAGAVVVVAAAGAAVLVVNAAGMAAEGAVRAVDAYGARLEQQVTGMKEVEANALRWQCAAADAVRLNARIRLLGQRAERSGTPVDLPPAIDLAGCRIDEFRRRLAETQRALIAAQVTVDARTEKFEWAAVVASLPPAAAGQSETVAALRAYRESLAKRHAPTPPPVQPVPRPAVPAEAVNSAVAALDIDANADERAKVLRAAALVAANPGEGSTYLSELRRTVQEINPRVTRRRLVAEWLVSLEQPDVAAAMAGNDPPGPLGDVAARLRDVVEGDADLTDGLRADARELIEWAGEMVRQRFIRDMVQRSLADLGYAIDEQVNTTRTAGLRVSRSDWRGEHSADVFVDRTGKVTARLVRELDAGGDRAKLRDHDRCQDFADDLEALAEELDEPIEINRQAIPQRRGPTDGVNRKRPIDAQKVRRVGE